MAARATDLASVNEGEKNTSLVLSRERDDRSIAERECVRGSRYLSPARQQKNNNKKAKRMSNKTDSLKRARVTTVTMTMSVTVAGWRETDQIEAYKERNHNNNETGDRTNHQKQMSQ